MSTTISTHQPRHVPLLASLSVAGLIAAAGVVGVVWHESTSSGTNDQSPALTRPAEQNARLAERGAQQDAQQYGKYQHYYRGQLGGDKFQPPTGGGRTVDGP